MKTPGYKITCGAPGCTTSEFFERTENHLDGDWWRIDGEDLCDDCAHAKEEAREEQIKLAAAEEATKWGGDIPYADAIRASLNGEG